jgi:PAS domain S-box-containing protein
MAEENFEKHSRLKEYAISVVAISAAAVFTALVLPYNDGAMYFLFLAAIFFSALYGGLKPGFFAVALSACASVFLIVYVEKLSIANFGDIAVLLLFCLTASFAVVLFNSKSEVQEAARLAESKYRMIFEDAITGIYETTLDGQYVAANPKLAAMLGYDSPHEMIRSVDDLNRSFYVEPERRDEFRRLIEENGNVAGFESEIYRRNGATIWITENALAVRDKVGQLIGFQGTTIDITSRKRAEAFLQEAQAELERKVVERTAQLAETNEVLRGEIVERQRGEDALRAGERQLRDLTAYLQSVREEERKYLARELHDELGQQLTALKMDLSWLAEKNAAAQNNQAISSRLISEKAETMIAAVDGAMNATRRIVSELRPAALDELGLEAAVEWLAQDFQKRTGIICRLETDFDERELEQDLTTTMFRIVQECLTNIVRHASAVRANIRLKKTGNDLLLEVEDDGRGIDETDATGAHSFGLLGMRERALLLGGTIKIERRDAAQGTRVVVRIPFSNESRK